METSPNATSSSSLHPLLWVAGVSVTLLSLAGIASLTGLLPTKTAPVPERPAIVATAPATEPVVAPVVPAAPVAAPQAPAVAVSKTIHQPTAKKKVEREIPASSVAMSPPVASGVPRDYVPPSAGSGVPPDYVPPPTAVSAPPPCIDCGVITNVRQVTNEGKGTGAGAIIGGIAGGVLGSNVGSGNTRTLASIAGAVGGGMLGNSIEKSQRQTTSYQVNVRMDDGSTRTIAADTLPSWRIGDKVKLVGGAIVSR
ncbi:MAG: glycine zipper 2TM domain-containing protein [Rhodocyclales bacterium]|nr:glycine zipper 2TM domain-containing protein [Rhodocyclales bacterium]